MASEKETQKLVRVFEEMYKYYKGWHFAYEYPEFFVYHQMGGDLSIFFTPDWNERGKVSIQIHNSEGQVIGSQEEPYSHPARNGAPYEQVEAYSLFKIVRPYLEMHNNW